LLNINTISMKKVIFTFLFFTLLGFVVIAAGCKKKNATCNVSCQIFDGSTTYTEDVLHTGTMSKNDCKDYAKEDQENFASFGYTVTCTEEFNP
jgi:hypothetical protein